MRYRKRKTVSLLNESEQSVFVDVLGNWFLLRGEIVRVLVRDLLSYLEEPHSWEEILQRFSSLESISEKEINEVLVQLVQLGVVEEYDEELENLSSDEKKNLSGVLNFFHLFTPYLEEKRGLSYLRRLQSSSVVVIGRGMLHEKVVGLLRENGVGEVLASNIPEHDDEFWQGKALDLIRKTHLAIVIGGKQNYGWFLRWNDVAIKEKRAVLYVEEDWTGGIVGPLVIPGETACYQCYVDRRQSTDDNESVYQLMKAEQEISSRSTDFAPIGWFLASMVVLEGMKFLSWYLYPETLRGVFLVDAVNYRIHFHPVLKLPYCERCGYVDRISPQMVWREEDRGV